MSCLHLQVYKHDLYYTGGTVIMDHGHGISTIYSHLENVLVSVGDQINQGDIIGTVAVSYTHLTLPTTPYV